MPETDTAPSSESPERPGSSIPLPGNPLTDPMPEYDPEAWDVIRQKFYVYLNKLKAMPQLIGWESIRRGMADEDRLRAMDMAAHHTALHGARGGDASQLGEQDMGHIVLGDMTYNQPPPPPSNNGLGKLMAAAALMASGAGIAVAAPIILDALRRPQAPAVDRNTDTLLIPGLKPPVTDDSTPEESRQ